MHFDATPLPGSGVAIRQPVLELAILVATHQGWRLPLPPSGLLAGLRELATGLLADLLRGFCTLNGLSPEKLVPLPSVIAR